MKFLQRFDRLAVFTFFWANVRLWHQISFPNWMGSLEYRNVALTALSVAVLLFPRNLWLFMLMLLASMARTALWMPFNPNHILFEFLSDAGIFLALLFAMWQQGAFRNQNLLQNNDIRERIFQTFAPAGRINLFLLYFFATFHKLNVDYFNLDQGCGTVLMHTMIQHWVPTAPMPLWLKIVSTHGTILMEAGIPLLLAIRRTRTLGVFIGMLFHFTLGLHPHGGIYSFTGLMFGYFFLFMPADFTTRLGQVIGRVWENSSKRWLTIAALVAVIGGLFLYGYTLRPTEMSAAYTQAKAGVFLTEKIPHPVFLGGFYAFLGWGLIIISLFLLAKGLTPSRESRERYFFNPSAGLQWLFTLLIFLNGFAPYIGLKTQTSFSMFSNLRTEGHENNHLFMPRAEHSPWQDDLVRIKKTDMPALQPFANGGVQLVFFEFQRILREQKKDFTVTYSRSGKEYNYTRANGKSQDDTQLGTIPNRLQWKLLRFRPVYDGVCPCQH